MKTPNPTKAELSALTTGALIIAAGGLPAKLNTVTSEVLARLLSHEHMTSLDAVHHASTTRLSAVVNYLQTAYGWTIARRDKAAGCADGRVAFVSEYWLDPEAIVQAMAATGAAQWCTGVRTARVKLRTKAALAKQQAARHNEAIRRNAKTSQTNQFGLFEGGAHA